MYREVLIVLFIVILLFNKDYKNVRIICRNVFELYFEFENCLFSMRF